jgi:hypothetical protein
MTRAPLALLFLLGALSAAADTSPRKSWRFEDAFGSLHKRWTVAAGAWEIDDGVLVARAAGAPDNCALLKLKGDLGDVQELQIDVTPVGNGGAGFQVQFGGQKFFHYRSGSGIWPPYVTSNDVLKGDGTTRVRLVKARNRYEFWIDGRKIIEKTAAPEAECPVGDVHLWATYGATIRFDNLRVR